MTPLELAALIVLPPAAVAFALMRLHIHRYERRVKSR